MRSVPDSWLSSPRRSTESPNGQRTALGQGSRLQSRWFRSLTSASQSPAGLPAGPRLTIPVAQHPITHPANSNQIVETLEESVPDAKFRDAVNPRIVPNVNFLDREPVHERQRREKPVHPFEQIQSF